MSVMTTEQMSRGCNVGTALACSALLVFTGWVVGSVADMDNLIVADGIVVAAVVVVLLRVGLLVESYVAAVYALRMCDTIPPGPTEPDGIRHELTLRVRL